MRMLQYKLPLVEMGYLVASGEIHNSEEAYPEECLPIKMTLLRYDADYLLGCVIDVITRSNGFRAYYKEALLGKLPNNYLYSFEVQPDSLVLSYTDGTIVLGAGPSQLKLQFDVPHRSGKADTKYTVSLNNDTFTSLSAISIATYTLNRLEKKEITITTMSISTNILIPEQCCRIAAAPILLGVGAFPSFQVALIVL